MEEKPGARHLRSLLLCGNGAAECFRESVSACANRSPLAVLDGMKGDVFRVLVAAGE